MIHAIIPTSLRSTPLLLTLRRWLGALPGLLVLGAIGCAGDLPSGFTSHDSTTASEPSPWAADQQVWQPADTGTVRLDAGNSPDHTIPKLDTTAPKLDHAAPKPDTTAPKPDTTAPNPGIDGPCPCKPGLYCVNGICLQPCPPATDACKVQSTCPAQHACLKTSKPGLWLCAPSTAPGSPCNATTIFCPTHYVCGTVSGQPSRCLPVCAAPGQPCGTGGVCASATGGCNFCTTI